MKRPIGDNVRRQAKAGERTGRKCPVCNEDVLRQEQIASNGTRLPTRLVCCKRGCPWQGQDR
jgi:hypothetical protein